MSKVKRGSEALNSGRRWTQWKEPEAPEVLASWRRSGLSAAAFSARDGHSVSRLRYWSQRLQEESAPAPPSVSFVPLAVGDLRRAGQLEIEHAGVVLRVREDLDVAHVARLVAALAPRSHRADVAARREGVLGDRAGRWSQGHHRAVFTCSLAVRA